MDRKNISRAIKLDEKIEEFTAIIDQLQSPTNLKLIALATETTGSKTVFDITDDDTDIRPFVINKKQELVNSLINHYTSRIADLEAEILTL
jgi:hypothetical protein